MVKEFTALDAYKDLIDELAEKHSEDSFKERLLLEVPPSIYSVLGLNNATELKEYALKKLRKKE